MRVLIKTAIICGGITAVASLHLNAQTIDPADQARIDAEIAQEEQAQSQEIEARREAARNKSRQVGQKTKGPDPLAVPEGGPCFTIRDVSITGYEAFGGRPKGYEDIIGTCTTAARIAEALNKINAYYQELGFITTRAYLPEQDISDGVLDVTVIAGRVEGYVYGDGKQANARISGAFPAKRGDLLNLRDLEQGLDNFNGPRSASGKFQLVPGEETGGSFVQVLAKDSRKTHFDLEFKNTGFDTTGKIKATANFGVDNLFGVNDELSLGITTTPFEKRAEKFSDAVSLSFKVPYKNWSFNFDTGASRYFFILPGINQSYPVNGRSRYFTMTAERLLYRDQTVKTYGYGSLKVTRTKSFIDNQEIESQRRRLTIGSLGLRGEKNYPKAKLEWDVSTKFGLDIINSYVLDKSIVSPEFRLVKARLSYERALEKTPFTWKAVLNGQYSDDILPSSEQFSTGGWSTVRGFHDDNMYGDSGLYLTNTLSWDGYKAANWEIKYNMGLDLGYVRPSALRSWSQDYIAGISLGADIKVKKKVTLTLKVAHALSRPSFNPPNSQPAFESDKTIAYIGIKADF